MNLDKIINKVNSAPAEESFVEPIFYKKTDNKIYFETTNFDKPVQFFKWFRWVFLIVSLFLSSFVLYGAFDKGSLNSIFSLIFAGVSLSIGLFGFFIITPILSKVFKTVGSQFDSANNFFPSFDLSNSTLQTPEAGIINFDDINQLKIDFKKRKWYQLTVETKCGASHFLLNFQKDLLKPIVKLEDTLKIKIMDSTI
ncbi:MAG: hypothetical protein NE330_08940 [Lentisphaeraceae bacterium]|nr:hypothetical protein [Lentisphaeraceae bacterium]